MTIGYGYPNLKMAEFYNAPGSPAWAMKSFLALALPDSHPFWQAKEEELPALPRLSLQPHPFMLIMRGEEGRHVQALTSGQYARFEPTFMSAKYEKFAYSNVFGFSVPGGEYGYDQGAFDSMLALCEQGDDLYRVRRKCEWVRVSYEGIVSLWKPWPDVRVCTWLIPWGSWHVRVHKITGSRLLKGGEGAYAVGCDGGFSHETVLEDQNESMARAWYPKGCTAVLNLEGVRKGQVVVPHPNTNVLYSRTKLPVLTGDLLLGETWLACGVLGTRTLFEAEKEWEHPPVYTRDDHGFCVSGKGKSLTWRFDTEEWRMDGEGDM